MRMSLIGMSNIGKTFWAKRIAAELGYKHINCDALIEKKLAPELSQGGYRGLSGIARWMGFPSDPQYKANSARYVECEREVLQETLDFLQNDTKTSVVVDTTGSVIYTGSPLLQALRAATQVLYFEASPAYIDALFKRFISSPKPVIWDTNYTPAPQETPRQALERCYPNLLSERARRYEELAHITIPFDLHKNHKINLTALIAQAERAS